MARKSLVDILGIPDAFASVVLVFVLVLFLAPYFAGADFGVLKVPNLAASMKRRLKIVGPVLLLSIFVLFLPLFETTAKQDPAELSVGKRSARGQGQATVVQKNAVDAVDDDLMKTVIEACGSDVRPFLYKDEDTEEMSDEDILRQLIKDEGDSAEAEDVLWHASLFHPKAVFHDQLSGVQAYTCEEIVRRDVQLFSTIRFQEIHDEVLRLALDGHQALVLTRHRERVLRVPKSSSRAGSGEAIQEIEAYLEWKFLRDDAGVWRIFSFLPGSEPDDEKDGGGGTDG